MYTLPTGRIVDLKSLSVAQPERHKNNDQPGLFSSIPVAPPAPQDESERTVETEHRRSFS